jgi:hypothetical protein
MNHLKRRLARLEASQKGSVTDTICVWCYDQEGFPAAVDRMVADAEITPADLDRCVPWWEWRGKHPETHEERLMRLSRSNP